MTLSARTPNALGKLVERYSKELPNAPLEAIAYAANTGRASHAERLVIEASTREELIERLKNLDSHPRHTARGSAPRAASAGWLFGGQGGCRAGMGRELYERYPVFREAWDACDAVIQQHWPRGLKTICWDEPERLETVDAQPALVAWQVALAELWKSWAGEPAWVAGHSLGELAAAVTAGILSRDDALRIVCKRAELLDTLTDRGAMLAIMAPIEQVTPLPCQDLSIAAENGPRQTVISGSVEAIERFAAESGLRCKQLATSHAFHSHVVEPVVEPFVEACHGVAMHTPRLGFLSTLTGEPLESAPEADYWARQMRQPVKFAQAVSHAAGDSLMLELSPTPVLRSLVEGDVAAAAGWKENEEADIAEASAANLWTGGLAIDYRAIHPKQRLSVSLPTYPFERQRHWFKPGKKKSAHAGEAVHPLLGRRLDVAGEAVVFETDLADHPWLDDHKLRGKPTLPATAYLELAWAVGKTIDASSIVAYCRPQTRTPALPGTLATTKSASRRLSARQKTITALRSCRRPATGGNAQRSVKSKPVRKRRRLKPSITTASSHATSRSTTKPAAKRASTTAPPSRPSPSSKANPARPPQPSASSPTPQPTATCSSQPSPTPPSKPSQQPCQKNGTQHGSRKESAKHRTQQATPITKSFKQPPIY